MGSHLFSASVIWHLVFLPQIDIAVKNWLPNILFYDINIYLQYLEYI